MSNKILVVEDSRAFRSYLHQQLTQIGCEVVLAESVEQARIILNSESDFLCTVLDYCLPDGQDGEIIDLVLSFNHRVIVLTAMVQENAREQILSKGVLDYIFKDSQASIAYLLILVQRLINNRNHKALVVDDSSTVRRHVVQLLEHQYIQTIEAENGNQAISLLQKHPDITLIITDHDMPEKDGIQMTRDIRITYDRNQLAILGLSGSDDRAMTARFLKAGANDFLYKPFNQEEFFCRVHQILDMKEATDKLYIMANQDALTGLWNRRYLFNQVCDGCNKRNIAMIDIDHFKKVNDTYGHDGGDSVLVTLSHILNIYFKDDVVARFGGEEFCIQSCSPFNEFIQQLERMRKRIEKTEISHNGEPISITISVGTSNTPASLDEQITQADDRLYQAKNEGRNRIVYE
ncbi:diguanylate cyclase response regulator [Vibrionales bacterium C3R12]|nr:diguanylate cyclase response regulator [Vibrionales bacterium C3R12]